MVAEHLMVSVNNLTDTLVAGINRLPPAHCFWASKTPSDTRKYWDVDCFARLRYRHESEYAEHFLGLFRQTIRQQTRSLTPVGVYLSGGIDSTSVACVAAGLTSQQDPINSFSLVFPGQDCDESHFIDMANRHCALLGHKVPCVPPPISHYLEQTTRFLDLCDGPNGSMLDSLRSLARRQGIRVLLTGYGGDEWFGRSGYYYAHLLKYLKLARLARQLAFEYKESHSVISVLNSLAYRGLSPLIPSAIGNQLRLLKRLARGKRSFKDKRPFGVVSPEFASRVSLGERIALPNHCRPGADPAHRYVHALLPLGWNVRGMEIENRGLRLWRARPIVSSGSAQTTCTPSMTAP
jgi:asparagine synthase (glutamine-hydrolysing)